MYKSQFMINTMMLHSFQDNAGISYLMELQKNVSACSSVAHGFETWFHSDMFWYLLIFLFLLYE